MRSFFGLLGKISAITVMAIGGLMFAVWVIAAIIALVIFLGAAVVCALPLCVGVLIQNWADRLEGKTSAISLNINKFAGLLERLERDR